MKQAITAVSAFLLLATVVMLTPMAKQKITSLPVVHAQAGCSDATLSGNYLFHYGGFNSKRNNYATELPIAAVGVGTFDGAGNASFSYHDAFNGHVGGTTTPDLGTYSVNSDCTFTLADPAAGQTWAGAIVGTGAEFDTIVTVTGYTATMSGKRQ
jgi:hypothetical protein